MFTGKLHARPREERKCELGGARLGNEKGKLGRGVLGVRGRSLCWVLKEKNFLGAPGRQIGESAFYEAAYLR